MIDSQSPGHKNSRPCARQRASEVGFLYFDLGEQAVAQLPLYAALLRCNRGYYAGTVLVDAELLKASLYEEKQVTV
jgi:hypothetical protein